MSTLTFSRDYSAMCTVGTMINPCGNTPSFFDTTYVENDQSPIDAFLTNCTPLNLIWSNKSSVSPEMARILLLGYVSAVESYFRSVFKVIINTDEQSKIAAHSYPVTYGAALFHDKYLLPEALLELYSFSGEKDVRKALNNFLGISTPDPQIKNLLAEFEKICQIRHCCVHRFGKLGTQNGISLGLNLHSHVLEKPLALNIIALADIASWLTSFIKVFNNYLFKVILDRTMQTSNVQWKWTFSKDKSKFKKLYKEFASTLDSVPSPSIEEIYSRFKAAKQPKAAKNPVPKAIIV